MSFTVTEYRERIGRFQRELQSRELDGALITQMADLYYLSGTAQNCHLFVPAAGEPLLLAYKDAGRAKAETVWDQVQAVSSIKEIPVYIKEAGWAGLKRLGLEMDALTWSMAGRYQEFFPGCRWEDVGKMLRAQRMVKSGHELEAVRYSAVKHSEVFRCISGIARHGMTELEIAAEFENRARRLGGRGIVRYRGEEQGMVIGLVLAGANAALTSRYDTPLGGRGLSPLYPSGASRHRWEPGEPLLIDYGGTYNDYIVDITRVYLDDTVPDVLHRAQEAALEIAAAVAAAARPGAVTGELYALAVKTAARAGLSEHFMGYGRQVPYIGHGVGLELNEWPVLARGDKTVLEAGMVFALEPKFVFPGLGSAGIEDTYVVTGKGAEKLTS